MNADIIGESDAAADAELIALLIDVLRAFRLTSDDFVIRLSSRNAWHDYFSRHQADPSKEYEFYQIVDKLERNTPEESDARLKAIGFSIGDVMAFIERGEPTAELQRVLTDLSARGMADFVKIDYHVIRGLAYYTGVVFEAFDKKGEFRAIAGGGRYDNLIKLISGGKVNLPSLGFGMGDVVLAELLKHRKLMLSFDSRVDVFCLIEDEALRLDSLKLIQQLRESGLTVEFSLTAAKADKQFKRAQELKATFTCKVQSEAGGATVKLRNLATREEKSLPPSEAVKVIAEVKRS